MDISDILTKQREHIIREWSYRLHGEVSQLYSKQPIEEITATVSEATDANYAVIVNSDFSGIDTFIKKIVEIRSKAGFPLTDVLKAFELYRSIVTPVIVCELEPSMVIEAIERINLCLSTTVCRFSDYFQMLHEKEIIGHIQNLETEVEKRTKDLSESENKFRDLSEKSFVGIYLIQDGLFKYVNSRFAEIHGYTIEEIVDKKGPADIVWPEDVPMVEENIRKRTFEDAEPLHYESGTLTKNKEKGNVEVYGSRTLYQGRPAVIGTTIDITERKQAEEALRESEERFRMLFESAGDAIVIVKDDIVVDCNEKVLTMFGYRREQVLGRLPYMFAPQFQPDGRDSKEMALEMMQAARLGTIQFFKCRFEHMDGTSFDAEVSLSSFVIHGEAYLQAILRDITDRENLNEELRRLSTAIEQAAEDVLITDPEGIIQYANPAFERITGYSRTEVIGQNPRFLKSGIHDAAFYEEMWNTIKGGMVWTGRFTNKRKDGTLVQEEAIICPLVNPDRRLMGYVALKRDITEEVSLEYQLRQAQKMEAIGTLAGGIAHDFNNILTVITGYAALLQMSMDETNPLRIYVDPILSSSQKAAKLTSSLLAFSRQQPITLAPFNLNKNIKGTEKLLKRLLTEDIELETSLAHQDIIIMADATHIDQILFNLATNARDAMKKGGRLTIETRLVEIDNNFRQLYGFGKPGRYALLSVADTGTGMDEETKEKIFEPFFTTKDVGKGTGLGLATVYGIIKQHNGYINVFSKPGEGTTFHIYLPAAGAIVDEDKIASADIIGGSETILIAEDNEGVRLLLKEVLSKHGYVVLESVDGNDAIDNIKKHPHIDLMILDSVMPKKNGREVYDEARTVIPNAKVLFMSGYARDIVLDKGIEEKDFHFISKPVLCDELLIKVRKILDS